MEIFRESGQLRSRLTGGAAVTVGTFDGPHLGHQRLLHHLTEQAAARGLKTVAVTFEPHPVYVLRPEIKVERITSAVEKIARLGKFNLDYLLILNFNNKLANYKAELFFWEILVGDLNARFIALGHNHTFGKNREGNVEFLKKVAPAKSCEISEIEPCYFNDQPISSSRIRGAIREGRMEEANQMLMFPYSLFGTVVQGKRLGQKLGYPTINIKAEEGKLLPRPGVYAARAMLDGPELAGMLYVHPEPRDCELELNLFNFNGEAYDRSVKVFPLSFRRDPIRFETQDGLAQQLSRDETEIKRFFGII